MKLRPKSYCSFQARIKLVQTNKYNKLNPSVKITEYKYRPVKNNIFSRIIKYFFQKQMKIQLKDPS